jgi:hypothetical protein
LRGPKNPFFFNRGNPMTLAPGQTTLKTVRDMVRQRCDMVNSNFITDDELNGYINLSYFELYDILTTKFQDYDVAVSSVIPTASGTIQNNLIFFDLPDDFYKLSGVDLVQAPTGNNYAVTLKSFPWPERNKFLTPITTLYHVANVRYCLRGKKLVIAPCIQMGVWLNIWYIPRPVALVADASVIDGVSGWEEYVIIDAAIKCLQKEESDVSVLMAQKMNKLKAIEDAASNRDIGTSKTMSDQLWSDYYKQDRGDNFNNGMN